jgi:predicted Zn-dependent protease
MILKSDQELAVESARQFAEMKANMPLETDRAKIDYIHCVAQAVVLQLEPEYRDLNWEMAIFQSDAVNAFAMPGGKIGVMTGILKAAQNQDQLAAVIGHEIAHVTARHANERASRGSFSNVGVQVAAVLLGGGHQGATYSAVLPEPGKRG